MKLLKRLIGLIFLLFVITLFMQNKDVRVPVSYFGLVPPLDVPFWILLTVCFCAGFVLAAVGDFIAYIKWKKEKRQLQKKVTELREELDRFGSTVRSLEDLNRRLKAEVEEKANEIRNFKEQLDSAACEKQQVSENAVS